MKASLAHDVALLQRGVKRQHNGFSSVAAEAANIREKWQEMKAILTACVAHKALIFHTLQPAQVLWPLLAATCDLKKIMKPTYP